MATKKTAPGQLRGDALKKFRRDQAKLYKAGLAKKGANEQSVTRHALRKHSLFRDFLDGKAKVVTAPTVADAAKYDARFQKDGKATRVGRKVAVPVGRPGEKVRYSKKTNDIVSTRKEGEFTVTTTFENYSYEQMQALEGKPGIVFSVLVARENRTGELYRRKTLRELDDIFTRGSYKNFSDWTTYVRVETVSRTLEKQIIELGDGDEGADAPRGKRVAFKRKKRGPNKKGRS